MLDAYSGHKKALAGAGIMEGFCDGCANNIEAWFNGEYCRIRCARLGVINRRDIKLRCGEWRGKDSRQNSLLDNHGEESE